MTLNDLNGGKLTTSAARYFCDRWHSCAQYHFNAEI